MKITTLTYKSLILVVGLSVSATATAVQADDNSPTGVFRITDTPPAEAGIQPVSAEEIVYDGGSFGGYDGGYMGQPVMCDNCWQGGGPNFTERQVRPITPCDIFAAIDDDIRSCPVTHWWNRQSRRFHARNKAEEGTFRAHLLCKWGYFVPTGCGGEGCPPIGSYERVYAVDPYHFDQRDGQIYAAQGSGVPMAVPLAPNVHNAYNYGWGVPSSRLTPISRVHR